MSNTWNYLIKRTIKGKPTVVSYSPSLTYISIYYQGADPEKDQPADEIERVSIEFDEHGQTRLVVTPVDPRVIGK